MVCREFLDLVRSNKQAGRPIGVFSICSAHPIVLEASMRHALSRKYLLVIEATSNQVNQFGGYTGMTPKGFVDYIKRLADRIGYPFDRILLGGDHLGPNLWKSETADSAMQKACVMIEHYVHAGFRKIHLDASMYCSDDKGDVNKPLDDRIVATRAAKLCQVAERAWENSGRIGEKPLYVVGTEVPIPGGMTTKHHVVEPTIPSAALETLRISQEVFVAHGLSEVWERVVGLVVQPGVEFGDHEVVSYDPVKAKDLHAALASYNSIVCEAHSTDYQPLSALGSLVKDHCCILKVGPWLTFAYREALFALESIEKELHRQYNFKRCSFLRENIERTMLENPGYWEGYYSKGPGLSFTLAYSYSDRIRYYWTHHTIEDSVRTLLHNLNSAVIPHSLLSQFFPAEYVEVGEGSLEAKAETLVIRHIQRVLDTYTQACGW